MKRSAFTLVELLVVIAIIGLLSTIAIVSTSSSREKARLAAAKQFAAQIDRDEGDSLTGEWDFDEGSGATATDISGYKNNGTLTSGPTWSTDTPSGTGSSIINGSASGYVSIPDSDILDIGTGSATRSLWFKTSQPDRGIMLRKSDASNVNGILCEIGSIGPGIVDCILNNPPIYATASGKYNDGTWHSMVVSIDRSVNIMNIYLDGKLRGSADISTLSGVNLNAASPMYIGHISQSLIGLTDSVHFFSNALTAMDVRKMYLAELPRRLAAINK